jgi:hypothetical protein
MPITIKEQNSILSGLKKEFIQTIEDLDLIAGEALNLLFPDNTVNENQINLVQNYLNGDIGLKKLRDQIKPKVIPAPKQKTVKVSTKKFIKNKK